MSELAAAVYGCLRGTRARVLMYHSISDTASDPFAVPPSLFRRQMEWVADSDLSVVSTRALGQAISQSLDVRHAVALTFDDAYRDFDEAALPILRDLGLTATIFVPTGRIGMTSDWNRVTASRPVMDQGALARLGELGFELGSHSVTHASLPELDDEALAFELTESLRAVRELAGREEIPLAYPYGRAEKRERAMAASVGYSSAYLAGGLWGNGTGTDLFAMTREPITRTTSTIKFTRLIRGRSDVQRLLDDVLARRSRRNAVGD